MRLIWRKEVEENKTEKRHQSEREREEKGVVYEIKTNVTPPAAFPSANLCYHFHRAYFFQQRSLRRK